MVPDPDLVARFRADLDALIAPGEPIGLAVSGGPDSLALLLLAAAGRPGTVEAASVDHRLRSEGRAESDEVARICERFRIPHRILAVEWGQTPSSGIQEKAREARYALLGNWCRERGIAALATGHHADDQAETLWMRLARGAGVGGLAAMRARAPLPGDAAIRLLRPLIGWRRTTLESICVAAGLHAADDPSNRDPRFERVRARRALATAEGIDPAMWARSAANLAAADEAIGWAAARAWDERAQRIAKEVVIAPEGLPGEILRRLAARAIAEFAAEGGGEPLRGADLDRLIAALERGETATLRGVKCRGGGRWRFEPAPPRAAGR